MDRKVFTKSDTFRSEYSCAVVRVGELTPIEGSDFLAKTDVFGTQIVVRKDTTHTGDIMIYAANETQLNEKFLSVNNLFEISERDKNANHEEVAKIMEEYEPIRVEADKLRASAKSLKSKMEGWSKKSKQLDKKVAKKSKQLQGLDKDSEEYKILASEISELKDASEDFISKSMSVTTDYTKLKKDISDLVSSGQHIVDEAKKHCGFFNKYGRVRCIVLKNTPSFGFLFDPKALQNFDNTITMDDIESYVGQEFDTVNGELFVKVFVPPVKDSQNKSNRSSADKKLKKFDRMIDGEFFFHYDTAQLQKEISLVKPDDIVDISVKKHGTSFCFANVKVKNKIKLPLMQRIYNNFVDRFKSLSKYRVQDYVIGYGPVYASRKVIKNKYINEGANEGFYGHDIWTEYGDIIYPYLSPGMTVYGEICGYITGSDKMIQKTYDYGCEKGENNIMFYRIHTPEKGEWDVTEVLEWTHSLVSRMKDHGDENWTRVTPIDLLYHGTLSDLYPNVKEDENWCENVIHAMKSDISVLGMEQKEPLCTNHDVPREGVCLRIHGDKMPRCWKLKTNSFAIGEALRMDQGDVDVEMTEGYSNDAE